ncbi:MAG TPA: gluconate 2-dehydrogenase subunit 3 family protein, partial [Niabella sp.]|nr:gluconate 2-dehydrogenase subunit 3 family protein [Niabella sp.]
MKRRESLKFIAASALASGAMAVGCKPVEKKVVDKVIPHKEKYPVHRYAEEEQREDEVAKLSKFFSKHEMETLVMLAEILIPRDEFSGSATDAKVAEFIEFTVKDQPQLQTPMRGGLRWVDMQCLNQFEKAFKDCDSGQQIKIVDSIAYPDRAKDKPELSPGVSFFSLMRNLACTGFYTS